MATFKDTSGREWEVRITVGSLRTLREAGVVVGDLLKNDMRGLIELADDPERFAGGLYALCRGQHDSVSRETFFDSLAGDALSDAWDAFVIALADFYPSQRRSVLLALADKTKDVTKLLTADAVKSLNDLDPAEVAAALTRSSASAGGARASSGSIPAG